MNATKDAQKLADVKEFNEEFIEISEDEFLKLCNVIHRIRFKLIL